MKKIAIISSIVLTIMLIGCNGKSNSEIPNSETNETSENSKSAEEGENEEGEEGVVEITNEQAETIGLELKQIEEKSLGNSVKVTGILELYPQYKANISPFVGGNVSSIKVIEGDKVRKGQVLAYLQHPDIISMQQEFQEKNDELVFLQQDFERKQTLFDKGVSSAKEFQMAQSKFRSTTSSVNALRSKLELLGLNISKIKSGEIYASVPITSPIGGFVDEVMVSLGDYVAPQTKMFAVSDNSEIHADFKVYEKDIYKVKEGQQIYFTVASKPDQLLKAKIHAIGKTFETDPKAIHVHADIHNEDKELLPGMYVEGRIVQGEKMALAVPEEAIVKNGEKTFIFVEDKDNEEENKLRFNMIPVNTGMTDLGYVEISLPAGISKDITVVTKGAYILSSEMIKAELGDDD
ncbi:MULTISPECIES: efflux RND transporter periplasmic adaptor subunit [Flavobacteriaceae]|uniref:RND family efflux transporter, MFP subunit n=5 Tax=Flavobacteriaceae TaxID=49546 RepID=I3C2Q5_9FLAO|nr:MULTISPECIES: efflux RND transporter periplasmic adaptor subunit [Flavobacteriaceae]EIJ37898.1 RND family efflux transporter, MFP subunit [Galbibacter orientalis DSM 19592]MAZ26002.1 efflux RND transporter periplasmic adaptor subunit [Cytophagaceae bacterium]MBO6533093.1 efflux RND transporter periplasmic adaptor subunit [Allomuricauda sp.]MBO6589998.1 efflux RND transporter periplasmic adaptor subunit [Allomuricauda sp.]MBO6619624.1 efflux RND transporter periplasmic adaptor subunit [Allom|tara:strand:+ start:352 stop:1572 length:1221 start_codon:yes stop_codon:yes gene_type:complete